MQSVRINVVPNWTSAGGITLHLKESMKLREWVWEPRITEDPYEAIKPENLPLFKE
jgi:hypothetical protein